MSLYRRGKNRPWRYDFTFEGVRYQGTTHTTNRDEAGEILAAIKTDLIRGKFDIPAKCGRFDQTAEKYLEFATTNRASTSTEKYHVRKHLIPHFRTIPLNSVNLELCERYKIKRLADGVTRATINRELTTLKSILRYAGEAKMAREGLGRYAKLFSGVRSKERQILSEAELEKLLAACDLPEIHVRAGYLRALVTLLAYSGLRPSEALRLRWSDLDFANRSIKMRQSKTPAGVRVIPMHRAVGDALQELKAKSKSDWVFPSRKKAGCHLLDFGKPFDRAVTLAAVSRVTPYSLRHMFLTRMERALTRRSILREVGGHTRDRHTNVYLHPDWQEKVAAIDRLQSPANFTTPAESQQEQTTLTIDEVPNIQGLEMVGPCGLEPQTSTVSR
jgi:integrase